MANVGNFAKSTLQNGMATKYFSEDKNSEGASLN